jgi:hypothetical protein
MRTLVEHTTQEGTNATGAGTMQFTHHAHVIAYARRWGLIALRTTRRDTAQKLAAYFQTELAVYVSKSGAIGYVVFV